MSERLFYFIVSGAISATSKQRAKDQLGMALSRHSVMDFTIEGIQEMRSQLDVDAVNDAVCRDRIKSAIAEDRKKRTG